MRRGTTPTIKFILPFDVEIIEKAFISFEQYNKVIVDRDIEQSKREGKVLSLTLTQKETLSFVANKTVHVQIRLKTKDGVAMASNMINVEFDEIIKEGEI